MADRAATRVALIDAAADRVRDATGIRVDRDLLEEGLGYPVQEADDDELRALEVALNAVTYAATTRPPCTRITRLERS